MIEVENLVKHYGPVKAVENVTFKASPGEVLGLLGPNGAGKSTTLRVLTGYLPPTSGSVRLAGLDIREHPIETRRRLGYLAEGNPLYESLGVWECLELTAALRGLDPAVARRRIAEAVEECSLGDALDKDVGELSKGFRQRLGLAAAILHDPEILVLDEPTSALDPNQREDVLALILKLKAKKTVLLSTHILSEAEAVCDRLLIVRKGTVAAQGTVAELRGRLAGEQTIYARLQAPRAEAETALATLARAEYADEAEPGCPGFRLTSAGDVRREVFRLAADRRWPLLELRREGASLDEIFRALTGEAS